MSSHTCGGARMKDKLYVIRKYVKAKSVQAALRKEKACDVHEVFVDDKWKDHQLADAIGFEYDPPEEEDDE